LGRGIFERFEHSGLQIEVSQIIIDKTDQPDVVVHVFNVDCLAVEGSSGLGLEDSVTFIWRRAMSVAGGVFENLTNPPCIHERPRARLAFE
jgi:hypothetical protein